MRKKIIIGIGVALVLALATLYLTSPFFPPVRHVELIEEPIDTPEVIPNLLLGIDVDSFLVENGKVKRNQNLSDILLKYDVSYATINSLANCSKEVFDVRKMKKDNSYHLFLDKDSANTAKYFAYEISKTEYLVLQLTDSVQANIFQKEIRRESKRASGVITSSLWNAMTDQGVSPMLALELSDIYAWTVDFFGIEEGDHFKVFYTQNYVDSTSVGIESIDAALFNHRGVDYYAFNFQKDSVNYDFFDEKGQSLRKAFLKAPLKFSRISSRFSNSRYHPVLKIRRPHHGIDYAAPRGTPVYTIGDGRIIARGYQAKGGGNYLKIKHNSVYTTVYMHLKGFAKGMVQGKQLKQGELIAFVGSTGLSTGPHLDFRVFKNGKPIDPLKVKAPPVEPVKDDDMERFKAFYTPLKSKLDSLK
ncbi:peptidoglycan DD-metalloendopeptidase family protein [bacterium]|nr:peptidoglycan DD-metalloendopeptidase family protein [bacterium]